MSNGADMLGFDRIVALIAGETVSTAGRALTEQLQPFTTLEPIQIRQRQIDTLQKLIESSKPFPLEEFSDLRPELKRCQVAGTALRPQTLRQLGQILDQVQTIQKFYQANRDALQSLIALIEPLEALREIRRELQRVVGEDGEIKDSASPELARIRRSMQQTVARLQREMDRIAARARRENWLHEENPTIREGRFVLPLRAERKRRIPGIFHGQSATGATVYVEPLSIVEINNELKELEQAEQEEIQRILINLTNRLRPAFPLIERDIRCLAELDLLRACARFGRRFQCHPPTVTDKDRKLVLIRARHPLLALVKPVVPLELTIQSDVNCIIITGPNAGGKTVAMKTVGLLSKMAMTGLPLPTDEGSQIPILDCFLTDIGDQQSIENDLSTFTSHVSNLKHFISTATTRSLVLIDELGTGTDPLEGAALGQAVLEELDRRGALTIVTTHHGGLKAFADHHSRVRNAAMEFDSAQLEPTYRIQLGLPGSSYALEISRRLGLPESLIARARELLGSDQVKLENLLLEVERTQARLAEKDQKVDQHKKTLDRLVQEYDERVSAIRAKYESMDAKIAEELQEIVRQSRARIEQAVKAIRERGADRESILKAKKTIESLDRSVQKRKQKRGKKSESVPKKEAPLKVGDWVTVAGLPGKGQITELPVRSKKIAVNIADKTLWVDRQKVAPSTPESRSEHALSGVRVEAEYLPGHKIDLRGMRVDEAEAELIRFIDRALLSGVNQVQIVHGMGTGVLQKMTREVLQSIPGVRKFYFEDFDRGGSGATIVEF